MALTLLLALCLILVMGSLIMTLSSSSRVDNLSQQNELLRKEMEHLRKEYTQLVQQVQQMDGFALPKTKLAGPASGTAAAPSLPTGLSAADKLKLLKQQAYQFQSLVEAFSLQNQGEYPETLVSLQRFAERQGVQEWVVNPYTEERNPLTSEGACLDITHDAVDEGQSEHAGKLLYQAHFDESDRIHNYTVAAFDELGVLLRREDGSLFTLSHA
ncbi:MAG: hypothetical protein AB7I41_14185 [Candidatus Sericytochromatia bacterium]